MYLNLLYLPLFSIAYLFVLSFLSSQHSCQFCFHCFTPHLAPCFSFVFQFVLKLVLFLTGKYNFWLPLFVGSIYGTLFLLGCFHFAYGCICICVYSVTLVIVVINLCLYTGLLQFCGAYFLFSFYLSPSFLFSFHFFIVLIFLNLLFFSTFIPSLDFPTVLFPLQLIFNVYKFSLSTSI